MINLSQTVRIWVLAIATCLSMPALYSQAPKAPVRMNDSHFHLTNYVQEGISLGDMLGIMGDQVERVALFGIPLQQTWSYENSGEYGPEYYLHSDAPLYYYSFTDAYIATEYLKLSPEQQKRFDPMITGFNPADMYGVDHIKRVLHAFPGVFTGIGEFTIHKEFVSSKVAGDVASLTDPALDSILSFAGESGLLVLIHCDMDIPFQKDGAEPVYLDQMMETLAKHKESTIIWAHMGLGRVVHPVRTVGDVAPDEIHPNHVYIIEGILSDSQYDHVYFDISWDEVAKYILQNQKTLFATAKLIEDHPTRFLFGSDTVSPKDDDAYYGVYEMYQPLWEALTPKTRDLVLKGNYNRLFDSASEKVRAWEAENVKP
ncbi:amidohydrolase family protein [Pontibacter sp. G13]|uniref:amidohydrolase family protein n=1 Tax=Pontibacter sp. G13 TaxID=3074898 RepID=UPI00288B7673|nr:amidohydrolase family protein [Pontibacter sp. G13]WNJ19112.1 amidohydrolase family protein [Pontibacter sp. G13]